MTAPVFTPLPTAPSRESSPETFSSDADAFLGALPTFQTQGNTLGTFCETQAGLAETSAIEAAASAAVISSTIVTYTDQTAFNSATPTAGQLLVLVSS